MLRTIKHQHLTRHSLGRDQFRILRHVARSVDLSGMVNPLGDLNARCRWDGVTSELTALIVVVTAVQFVGAWGVVTFGDRDSGDLEVILGLTGGVGSEEEAVDGIRLVGWAVWLREVEKSKVLDDNARLFVGKPLASQAGPVERVRDNEVVEIWCILLPENVSITSSTK